MMIARHSLHGLRILVSYAPELGSRYPSSKLPWLYESRSTQVTLPGLPHRCKKIYALAVSERPRPIHCSDVVVSHYRRETPSSTTHGNATVTECLMATSSNAYPARVPFTRWPRIASWLCIGATRGSHCVSRGMSDRPTTQRSSAHETRFLENLRFCREYVPHK